MSNYINLASGLNTPKKKKKRKIIFNIRYLVILTMFLSSVLLSTATYECLAEPQKQRGLLKQQQDQQATQYESNVASAAATTQLKTPTQISKIQFLSKNQAPESSLLSRSKLSSNDEQQHQQQSATLVSRPNFAANPETAALSATTTTTTTSLTATSSGKARYKTMYACEDRQLVMDCDYGSKINLIRANYGRFSITQCNEQGQLDLSTDCMSPITFRIMRDRCQDKQKCSVNATSSIFGDKCPKTRKYLEVHFQCQLDLRISAPSSNMMEPDRIDLRNTTNLLPTHNSLYPQTLGGSSANIGSSSILPPNNPTFNQPSYLSTNPARTSNSNPLPELDPQFSPSSSSVPQLMRPVIPGNYSPQPGFFPPLFPSPPQQTMTVMNSDILTYNSNSNNNNNNASSEPIVITLRHNHTENMHNPRCVLWDQSANQWTGRGSQIISTNSTHTVCAFDQATSYLLVMDYIAPSQPYNTVSNQSHVDKLKRERDRNLAPTAGRSLVAVNKSIYLINSTIITNSLSLSLPL